MRHKDFISELSERMQWTTNEVEETLSVFCQEVASSLVENNIVYMQHLGQFEAHKKVERISVNHENGKRYLIPPQLEPEFTPETTIKNKLKVFEGNE